MIQKIARSLFFILSLISFHVLKAFAETSNPTSLKESSIGEKTGGGEVVGNVTTDISIFPYLLKVVFFLIIIGILIYFLIRFLSQQSRQSATGLPLRLLGGVALGQNRTVQVVQVGRKILVLGVGQDVQVLSEIYDEEEVADWVTNESHTPKLLDSLKGWKKKNKNQVQSFDKLLEEQWMHMKESRNQLQDSLYHSSQKDGEHYEG